jgi:hypothetical protein
LMYDKPAGEYPRASRHLWEPFLHKFTIWCVCVFETFVRPAGQARQKSR